MFKSQRRMLVKFVSICVLCSSFLVFESVQAAAKLSDLVDASKVNPSLPDPTRFGVRVEVGDTGEVKKWLAAGLDPNYESPVIGSGLMIAAWEGNLEMMHLFLNAGANVNFINKSGETPLMMAAWKNQMPALKLLLERGAQVNRGKINEKKNGEIGYSYENARENSIPQEWSAFHYSVFAGHKELSQYLLEKGADLNAMSTNGSTPLMMALYEGKTELAQWLLDLGARTDILNYKKHDSFVWAMRYGHKELARRIGGEEKFAKAIKEPADSWGLERKGEPVPAEVAKLMVQKRHAEVGGDGEKAKELNAKVETMLSELGAKKATPEEERQKRAHEDNLWRTKVAVEELVAKNAINNGVVDEKALQSVSNLSASIRAPGDGQSVSIKVQAKRTPSPENSRQEVQVLLDGKSSGGLPVSVEYQVVQRSQLVATPSQINKKELQEESLFESRPGQDLFKTSLNPVLKINKKK